MSNVRKDLIHSFPQKHGMKFHSYALAFKSHVPSLAPLLTLYSSTRITTARTTSYPTNQCRSGGRSKRTANTATTKSLVSVRTNQIRKLVSHLDRSFFLSKLFDLEVRSLTLRVHWIDKEKLVKFILDFQDIENGKISDRPEDVVDVYHTYFGVAGLFLLEYPEVKALDPTYALPVDVVNRIILVK
ncbi:hypothetical protein ACFX1Q_008216 [Malus domestica]